MGYMTKLDGVPDKDDVRSGMAYFAGTGPAGKTCGTCRFRGYFRQSRKGKWDEAKGVHVITTYKTGACEMYKKLTGNHGSIIRRDYAACKYYEARK